MELIKACRLKKNYTGGHATVQAVNNISLTLNRGEILLIAGPSGSGKTTLLSMLGCITAPTDGELHIKNRKISGLSEQSLQDYRRKHIGFVFQSFNLFTNLTVLENLTIIHSINREKPDGRAEQYLEKLGLEHRIHHKPDNLSIGEKQRVAIGRALMNNPDIILADEPTGNLDRKTGHAVAELLSNLAREENRGVIIVTHDMRLKDLPDKIIYIEDGIIKENNNFGI